MTSARHRRPQVGRRYLLGLAGIAGAAALPVGAAAIAATSAPDAPDAVPASSGPSAATPSPGKLPAAQLKPVVSGGGPVPNQPGKVLLGAYLDLQGRSLSQSLGLRRAQLGRGLRIVHRFYGWADPLPRAVPEVAADSTVLLSWRGTHYDEINDGSGDDWIAQQARRLVRYGRPVLLRWGWEMNGDWYPWGGDGNDEDTDGYVAAWRRLHRIFGEQGADNVSWVWSPNWNSNPAADWNRRDAYYPGDRFVDWVGVSGYNLRRETPATLFDDICAAYAERKPIMITEVGAVDRGGRTKADWIALFAAWVAAHPAVGGVVWFDTDTHPGSPERWRVDTDEAALAAYRAMAQDPRFRG